jgi:hypothetical protein
MLLETWMTIMKTKLTTTIPPKSGPQSEGLLINYNTVKPVKLEKINGRRRQVSTKRRARDKSSIT